MNYLSSIKFLIIFCILLISNICFPATTNNLTDVSTERLALSQSPYGGTARNIPGIIEGEHYDLGGAGISYYDATNGNTGGVLRSDDVDIENRDGGQSVGWIDAGEWLEYTVNANNATYDLELRVASPNANKSIVVKLDGSTISTITTPNTGDWADFQTIKVSNINISGGNNKILRLEFPEGGLNFNWIKFTSNNTVPNISFSNPSNNQNFNEGDNVFVNVSASDDGSIANVKLYLNNTLISKETTSPYTWGDNDAALKNMAPGTYQLKAVATDNTGLTSETSITILVNGPNKNPTVNFTTPVNYQTFNQGDNISVNVSATDDGSISFVKLFLNGALIRQDNTYPYAWDENDAALKNMPPGTHTLKAIAQDNAGLTSEVSILISVIIQNNPPYVEFTKPDNNQYFNEGDDVNVAVSAIDDGSIANVLLYLNGEFIRRENTPPYNWGLFGQNDKALGNLSAGSYKLKAIAVDNTGLTSETTISFIVHDPKLIVHLRKRNAINFAIEAKGINKNTDKLYLNSSNTSDFSQQWKEIDRGDGYFSYQNMFTNECIDGGNGGAKLQSVYLNTCTSDNQNQQWRKAFVGSVSFRLEKRNAPDFSISGGNGGTISQNLFLDESDNNNQNQHWTYTTISKSSAIQSIENNNTDGDILLYPNPATVEINILLPSEYMDNASIYLFDVAGNLLKNQLLFDRNTTINIDGLKVGMYLVQVKTETKTITKKLMKSN